MKTTIYGLEGSKKSEIELPSQFGEKIRLDLIKKAFLKSQIKVSSGASARAGKNYSAKLSRRRRDYRTGYGRGMSRVPRKVLWRRGTQFGYFAALAPGTVGGRRAHPLKPIEDNTQKINKKEKNLAIRSALAGSVIEELVKRRNHKFEFLPIVVEDSLENLKKSKEIRNALEKLGLGEELKRVAGKKIRSGKGTRRGRKYKKTVGPLIIVSKKCDLQKSARNIAGVDVTLVQHLNVKKLAPGGVPGRLCIFTQSSIKELEKGLFNNG